MMQPQPLVTVTSPLCLALLRFGPLHPGPMVSFRVKVATSSCNTVCGLLELTVGRRTVSGLAATVHQASGDVFWGLNVDNMLTWSCPADITMRKTRGLSRRSPSSSLYPPKHFFNPIWPLHKMWRTGKCSRIRA